MTTLPPNWAVLDIETTISNNGNPFDRRNKACYIGLHLNDETHLFKIEYDQVEPYGSELTKLEILLRDVDCLIGFNIKFDLHWLRRYLPSYIPNRVWDCQLFEYIKSNQNKAYPDLDSSCESYGLAGKIGDIAEKYWNNGIDTTHVPEDELRSYLTQDLLITKDLFLKQYQYLEGNKRKLFLLHCADLLVLQEMEFNGLIYNTQESLNHGNTVEVERRAILAELDKLTEPVRFNWNSSDEISVFLYGGFLKRTGTEIAERVLKSGAIKKYERACVITQEYSGRLDPKATGATESKSTISLSDDDIKELNGARIRDRKVPICRIYSVAEDSLRTISTTDRLAKSVIKLVLKLSELNKLEGTYYFGIPKLIQEMNWPENKIHGTINQCRAITGRTSSSKPNLQNFDSRLKVLFPSRYVD